MLHAISNRVIWDEGGGPSHTTKFNPFEIAPSGLTTVDRKSTRLNSSHGYISYAVFCLKKKKKKKINFNSYKRRHVKVSVYISHRHLVVSLVHTKRTLDHLLLTQYSAPITTRSLSYCST